MSAIVICADFGSSLNIVLLLECFSEECKLCYHVLSLPKPLSDNHWGTTHFTVNALCHVHEALCSSEALELNASSLGILFVCL